MKGRTISYQLVFSISLVGFSIACTTPTARPVENVVDLKGTKQPSLATDPVSEKDTADFKDPLPRKTTTLVTQPSDHFPAGIAMLKREQRIIFVDIADNELTEFPYNNHRVMLDNGSYSDYITHSSNGIFQVCLRNAADNFECSYMDRHGNKLIDETFSFVFDFEDGMAIVTKDDSDGESRWGIINQDGDYIVDPVYFAITPIYRDFFWAKVIPDLYWTAFRIIDGKPTEIDLKHPVSIIGDIHDDVCWVDREYEGRDNKRAFYNVMTEEFISGWFSNAGNFYEGLAPFELNDKWGFINPVGKIVIPARFGYASSFSEGLAIFTTMRNGEFGKWGVIDKRGKVRIKRKFDSISKFKDGYARVRKTYSDCRELAGFINRKGKLVIDYQFYSANLFSEGLAAVVNAERKWGFVDKAGKMTIDFQFDHAIDFSGGVSIVEKSDNGFVIDNSGKCIIGCNFKITPKAVKVSSPEIRTSSERLPKKFETKWVPMSRSNEKYGNLLIDATHVQMPDLDYKSTYKLVNESTTEPQAFTTERNQTRYTIKLQKTIILESCIKLTHLSFRMLPNGEMDVWDHESGAWEDFVIGKTEHLESNTWGIYWLKSKSDSYN